MDSLTVPFVHLWYVTDDRRTLYAPPKILSTSSTFGYDYRPFHCEILFIFILISCGDARVWAHVWRMWKKATKETKNFLANWLTWHFKATFAGLNGFVTRECHSHPYKPFDRPELQNTDPKSRTELSKIILKPNGSRLKRCDRLYERFGYFPVSTTITDVTGPTTR